MRFATDGAKMTKAIIAVKGVCFLVPSDRENIVMPTPDDECTLYLYTGTHKYITTLITIKAEPNHTNYN